MGGSWFCVLLLFRKYSSGSRSVTPRPTRVLQRPRSIWGIYWQLRTWWWTRGFPWKALRPTAPSSWTLFSGSVIDSRYSRVILKKIFLRFLLKDLVQFSYVNNSMISSVSTKDRMISVRCTKECDFWYVYKTVLFLVLYKVWFLISE